MDFIVISTNSISNNVGIYSAEKKNVNDVSLHTLFIKTFNCT